MKCVCGYEDFIYNEDESEIIKFNEDFIQSELKVVFEADGNYYRQLKSETVYICPKCGTLKINI
jgi:hypothetical protein